MDAKLQNETFVFRVKPQEFSPKIEAAACYIEFDGKFLFLRRSVGKSEGGKWGVPGGKMEQGESSFEAVIRETVEETQIALDPSQINFVGKLFIRKPELDYVYHMYHVKTQQMPDVILNNEHEQYQWLTLEEIVKLPVMSGGLEALSHFSALTKLPKIERKPFYFIRHGETDINANSKIKRVDYDLPLNEKGRSQAFQARKALEGISLNSVCFSPIQRAVETKDILISSLELEQSEMEDLSECKAKIWTKMVQLEEGQGAQVCGEVEGFLERVMRGLDSALKKEPDILVVAHSGVYWALCYCLSIENYPWKVGNCALMHFQPVGDTAWKAEIVAIDK